MTISFEAFIMGVTALISAVSLFFALRKQKHNEDNMDSDTISNLFQTVKEYEEKHKTLRKEFDTYKKTTQLQIQELVSENIRLRTWAKKLVAQLEAAGIVPVRFEDIQ